MARKTIKGLEAEVARLLNDIGSMSADLAEARKDTLKEARTHGETREQCKKAEAAADANRYECNRYAERISKAGNSIVTFARYAETFEGEIPAAFVKQFLKNLRENLELYHLSPLPDDGCNDSPF